MFKQRFSTTVLGWFAGILHSQVVLSGRKLFFPSLKNDMHGNSWLIGMKFKNFSRICQYKFCFLLGRDLRVFFSDSKTFREFQGPGKISILRSQKRHRLDASCEFYRPDASCQ